MLDEEEKTSIKDEIEEKVVEVEAAIPETQAEVPPLASSEDPPIVIEEPIQQQEEQQPLPDTQIILEAEEIEPLQIVD